MPKVITVTQTSLKYKLSRTVVNIQDYMICDIYESLH